VSLKIVIGVQDQRKYMNPDSESDLENNGRRQIINIDPTATIMKKKINQKNQQILNRGSSYSIQRCG
jgi:hypothetical protein